MRRAVHRASQSCIPSSASQVAPTSSSGSSHTQSQHLHGHGAVALAAVDAGVIGEDISDWLGSQVVGVNQRHDGLSAEIDVWFEVV